MQDHIFAGKKPLLMAHRGFTPVAPENTLASFTEAAQRGFWAIETDVHATLDGVLVCCHNFSLKKMYGVDITIEEHTMEELSSLRVCRGSGVDAIDSELLRLPLFDEYLAICREYACLPFIETKGDVVPETLKAVERFGLTHDSVLSSITFEHIKEARRLSGDIFVHHIFSSLEQLDEIADGGRVSVSFNYPNIDDVPEGLVDEVHKKGAGICFRAGDTLETVKKMLALGVDFIPTNCMTPELCRDI